MKFTIVAWLALVGSVLVILGLWALFRFLAAEGGAKRVGPFAMVIGAIGIIMPLPVLMGNSSEMIQIAVLVSGAIIFGCGAIATAIGRNG